MNTQLWNFLHQCDGIDNRVIYIENHHYQFDPVSEDEEHSVEINVEDTESETIDAGYVLYAQTKDELEKYVKSILQDYFEEDMVVENW